MKKSKISVKKRLTNMAVFFLMSVGLFAQTDFSGKWELNESKSKFGEGGGPGGPMGARFMTVTQNEKTLTAEQKMTGRDGEEFNVTVRYNLDGTVSENKFMMDRIRKSVLTWSADKKVITISSSVNFERDGETREIKTTEKWSLSDDKNTLFIESVRPSRDGGSRTVTLAYDKK